MHHDELLETPVMTTRVPLLVPVFNNPYYVERFCKHVEKFNCFDIVLFDNNSNYGKILEFYDSLPGNISLIRMKYNFGPRLFWLLDNVYEALPNFFCISDPDIEFNENIPYSFIDKLIDLASRYQVGKVGFALDIAEPHRMTQKKFRHADGWKDIWESEGDHWQHEIRGDPVGHDLYVADIDTTFALYDKRYFNRSAPFKAIRVAGLFTAKHLPWYTDVEIPDHERAFYAKSAIYSYFASDNVPIQLRSLFPQQDK